MPKPEMVTAAEFAALLEAHNLRSMTGYERVAKWLYLQPQTVRVMCSTRGALRAYYDLVRIYAIKEGTGRTRK